MIFDSKKALAWEDSLLEDHLLEDEEQEDLGKDEYNEWDRYFNED